MKMVSLVRQGTAVVGAALRDRNQKRVRLHGRPVYHAVILHSVLLFLLYAAILSMSPCWIA